MVFTIQFLALFIIVIIEINHVVSLSFRPCDIYVGALLPLNVAFNETFLFVTMFYILYNVDRVFTMLTHITRRLMAYSFTEPSSLMYMFVVKALKINVYSLCIYLESVRGTA